MSNNEIWKMNRFHTPYIILVSNFGNVKQLINLKVMDLKSQKDKKGNSYVTVYDPVEGIKKLKINPLITETFTEIPSDWLVEKRQMIDPLSVE